jgi:hypothetical protein
MTMAFNILKVVITILPIILELIKAFETNTVAGDIKKQAVMEVVGKLLDSMSKQGLSVPGTLVLNVVDTLIDGVVSAFNVIGYFNKKEV